MARIGEIRTTEWFRASEYEVVGGTHIAPVEGAEIERFDPFEAQTEFWKGRERKGKEPPYVTLSQLDLNDVGELLNWCRSYGLLGILPQQTLEAWFWPRWSEGKELLGGGIGLVGAVGQGSALPGRAPIQRYYRQWQGTQTVPPSSKEEVRELLTPEELEGSVTENPDLPKHPRKPMVRHINPFDGSIQPETFAKGYACFFPRAPDVVEWTAWDAQGEPFYRGPSSDLTLREGREVEVQIERYEYPAPGTEKFRATYGEPIHLIRRYVRLLRETLEFWDQATDVRSRQQLSDLLQEHGGSDGPFPKPFTAALRSVMPTAELEETDSGAEWRRKWGTLSYYGSLNVMMLQDFVYRRGFVKLCKGCKELFVTDNDRQEHCSDTCAHTAYMRRYRSGESGKDGDQ